MKSRAFTFVELLLVMLILGIIISLTLPIIKNIKDDDDIYRAYMKKANQDVTDAMGMIFIKEPRFTGFEMFEAPEDSYAEQLVNSMFGNASNCTKLRNAFNKGLSTFECGACTDTNSPDCTKDENNNVATCTRTNFKKDKNENSDDVLPKQPGLILAGKTVLVFQYDYVQNGDNEATYGNIYVDMNKDKSPNAYCKDRYKFIIYNDRVAMDPGIGCGLEL